MPLSQGSRSLKRSFLLSFAAVLVALAAVSLVLTAGGLYLYYRSSVAKKISEVSSRFEAALADAQDSLLFRTRLLADVTRIEGMDLDARVVRDVQVYTLRWLKQDGVELVAGGSATVEALARRAQEGLPGTAIDWSGDSAPRLVGASARQTASGPEAVIAVRRLDHGSLTTFASHAGGHIALYGPGGAFVSSSLSERAETDLERSSLPSGKGMEVLSLHGDVYGARTFPLSLGEGGRGRYAVFYPVGTLRALAVRLAVWQAVGFGAAFLVLYRVYRRLIVRTTDDVEVLTAWARHFTPSNAVPPPELARDDEVGVLGRAFCGLVDELNGAFDEVGVKNAALEEANHSLERNVWEKTRELEEQRHLLDTVLDGMPSAVFLLEPDGRVAYANRAARTAFNNSGDSLPWRDRLAGETFEAQWDGRHYLVLGTRLEGSPRSVVVAQDVTDRKALQSQLLQAQKLESVGRLAGGVAHDFNNVLGAIVPCVEVLRRRVSDPKAVTHLDTIEKAALRAADVVRRLLTFSRSGEFRPLPLDLNEAVGEALTLLGPGLKGVEVESRLSPDLPLVKADETQIQQVLINLALNALDAMGGKGRLLVETRPSDDAKSVFLCVEDTGPGIPEHLHDKIFDPFFTTKEPGKGTGLGLSIVYGVVERHGGRVRLLSPPKHGARFELEFPAIPGFVRPQVEPRCSEGTVLAVDDDAALLNVLGESLESFGFRVVKASGGAEALESFRAAPASFDAAVLDVRMAGPDGVEVARRLREARPDLPVVFITGFAGQRREELVAISGRDPVGKPFSASQLAEAIRDVRLRAVA